MMLSTNKTMQFIMHCTMQFVTTVLLLQIVLRKKPFFISNKMLTNIIFHPRISS